MSSRRWSGDTALSLCTCSFEHPQGEGVLRLKISALTSIWRNLDELVDDMFVQGDGHQMTFTPAKEKVSSGACLGFQAF